MKNQILLLLTMVLITACDQKGGQAEANKIYHESQLPQVEQKEFKHLSKGGVSISNISPLIIGSDGCYWVIGERENAVTVVKLVSDTTKKQICIPVQKAVTMNTDSASSSAQVNNQNNCPATSVSWEPCASGFEGKKIRIKTQNYANGQCQSIVSDDSSQCVATTKPK